MTDLLNDTAPSVKLQYLQHGKHIPIPELFLALPTQISHKPVRVKGVLWRHAPAHDGVQEGFALPGIETQDLERATKNSGERKNMSDGDCLLCSSPECVVHAGPKSTSTCPMLLLFS